MQLEPSYRRLKAAWRSGHRDRDEALQLLFLSWMHWADPPFSLPGWKTTRKRTACGGRFYEHFGGEASTDAEFLHVAGMMAGIIPWTLGDEVEWASRAIRMQARSLDLRPDGFSPEFFEGRSDYGDYFAHQAGAAVGR